MAFSFETSNEEEENSNPELFVGVQRKYVPFPSTPTNTSERDEQENSSW